MPNRQDISTKRFEKLLITTVIMTYVLIVAGGIVRVTGSGLGCPDWPTCFGRWVPPPQLDAIIEYSHRLIASLTSLLILASAVIGWRRFRDKSMITRPLILAVLLLGFQGLLGGIVVLLETPPDLVAVHLTNALLIISFVIIPATNVCLNNREMKPAKTLKYRGRFARLSLWTAITTFIVLISGAVMVGSNATFACSGWPLCNGQLIPANLPGWTHMFHRVSAAAASILVIALLVRVQRAGITDRFKKITYLTAALFFSQAAIGAVKVSYKFPVVLLGLHVAIASAVWTVMMILVSLVGFSRDN